MKKAPKISKKRLDLLQNMVSICSTAYNDYIQNYGHGGEYEGEGRHFNYPTRGPKILPEILAQGTDAAVEWL